MLVVDSHIHLRSTDFGVAPTLSNDITQSVSPDKLPCVRSPATTPGVEFYILEPLMQYVRQCYHRLVRVLTGIRAVAAESSVDVKRYSYLFHCVLPSLLPTVRWGY